MYVMNSFIIKMFYARLVVNTAKTLILKLELEPFAVLFYYHIFVLVKKLI